MAQFNSHLATLFTEQIANFSICRPDILSSLEELTRHFKRCHETGVHTEVKNDPTAQYVYACSPIGTPRGSNETGLSGAALEAHRARQARKLPSPSGHVDERNPFSESALDHNNDEKKD